MLQIVTQCYIKVVYKLESVWYNYSNKWQIEWKLNMKSPILIAELMFINDELNEENMSEYEMISELAYKLSIMCKLSLTESVNEAKKALKSLGIDL